MLCRQNLVSFDSIRLQSNVVIQWLKVVAADFAGYVASAAAHAAMDNIHNLICILRIIIQNNLAKPEATSCRIGIEVIVADTRAIFSKSETLNFIKSNPLAAKAIAAAIHHRAKIFQSHNFIPPSFLNN
jgi:hypothetical protein